MRLIDADALIAEDMIDSFVDFYDSEIFEAIIEEAPTIDAVPVCRCKDCKRMNDVQFCVAWEGFVREDDFCSYGDRKDGEG